MPSEKSRYEPAPPIPSYDEAIASGASSSRWPPSLSPIDRTPDHETEAQSLLPHSIQTNLPRGAPAGYRPPHAETDDEESVWSLDGDDSEAEETAGVRREMQELEVEDPLSEHGRGASSSWTKRIGFSRFSLPQWKWKWRWRLPRLTVRLPRASDHDDTDDGNTESRGARARRWLVSMVPTVNSRDVLLFVGRLFALLVILGSVYLLFISDLFGNVSRRLNGRMFDPEDVRRFVQLNIDRGHIKDTLQHLTSFAHLAGTEGDYALAVDVHNSFSNIGFDQVVVDEYYVYLNYPKQGGRAVQIMSPDGKKATWTAAVEELEVGGESAGRQTYAFHGHSKSGDVKGPLIYANYGSRDDFKRLADKGIDTKGAIALVRYYGSQRDQALKVKAAEMAGFAGCIIYSDPAEIGFGKGEPAPKGRSLPSDGVQRASVSLSNWVIGDVLTPGWESTEGQVRETREQTRGLVQIPSLPLAWRDAQVLLQHIQGFGEPCPKDWKGGVPNIEWWTGNSSSPIIRLKNEQDEVDKQKVRNVYTKLEGIEQTEKSIIIGNHRDAWAFGATQPNSGTAIMLEVARVFGELAAQGWRPLRTIEFMSWDAGEYNMIGSTEYVEKNLEILRQQAYAYINLDAAVSGREFHAAGSPMFRKLITKVLDRVLDPVANSTLLSLWNKRKADVEAFESTGDYVAFQDIAGTSSLDIRFEGETYPSHSSYDNFDLMQSVGDPDFIYHGLLGQVLALIVLDLADRPILPFDLANYASSLGRYVGDLSHWADVKGVNKGEDKHVDLDPLRDAANHVSKAVSIFEQWEPYWERNIISSNGWEPAGLGVRRLDYNNRLAGFESDLLDLELGGGVSHESGQPVLFM
ncbi:Zn-dependent exopeptidase [Xylariaceae sp. FL0594]|nr:Zn-dependent exopeptidase [Xylariaceae sp. FL0594]